MPFSSLSVSIESRKHHPYRSLYAELLFQGFHDALTMATEASTTVQGIAERPILEGELARAHRGAMPHTPETQLPERDGPQR